MALTFFSKEIVSKLTLKFYNNAKDMDIVETREYIVTVDENLKVKYEEK